MLNSLPLLNAIAFWGLWVAGIAGGIAAVAGLAGGLAATRASDLTRAAAETRIAEANQQAAEATARAEFARLQAAKIADGLSWRELLPDQRVTLVQALRGRDFEVWTSFVGDDPEAARYRNQVDDALKAAGLKTKYFSGWAQAAGISILGDDTPERRALSAAFTKAGIPHLLKPAERHFGQEFPCLIIGTKPERL